VRISLLDKKLDAKYLDIEILDTRANEGILMATGDTYTLHDGEQVTVTTSTPELLALDAVWAPLDIKPFEHLHPKQDERFHVHAGELTISLGGREHVLRAGQSLDVPSGAKHAMWNSGDVPTRATWEVRPALRTESFFRSVHELRAAGRAGRHGMITPLAAGAVLRGFRDELRLPVPAPLEGVVVRVLGALGHLRGYRAVTA
jgi:mannose-6-phosphate isomerase-like protein (cupin superfamily)